MIVKIMSAGKSFAGLSTYLTHDAEKAKTEERVAWTHTLNLPHDHVPSAVDTMVWTARNAELLKQEAGIRAGGRPLENAVKHVSLNWSPEEDPSREHMISASEQFLGHMGWDEHQVILIAHDDRAHSHVHLLINAVHPQTGLKLDDGFEQRRAQAWALDYERENGRIYCEQRLLNADEREECPTRPAWMAFKNQEKEFENAEKSLRSQEPILINEPEIPENINDAEWKRLKEIQKNQRLVFFAEGKQEFSELRNSIYREVREEFRDRWGEFYAAWRDGADADDLATMKAELVAEQKEVLDARRDEACDELRQSRDGAYRELLEDQRDTRLGLRWRQEAGLDNAHFLLKVEEGYSPDGMGATFREAADEVTARQEGREQERETEVSVGWPERDNSRMKSGFDVGARLGQGIGFGLISLFESIADGFVGSKPAPRPRAPEPEPSGPNPFEAAIDEARKAQQQRDQEEAEREWRLKQRSAGE